VIDQGVQVARAGSAASETIKLEVHRIAVVGADHQRSPQWSML